MYLVVYFYLTYHDVLSPKHKVQQLIFVFHKKERIS